MKILHVPFTFYPDPGGGTEVYVEALAREQQRRGDAVAIAAPGEREARYEHDGLPVRRFPRAPTLALRDLYGDGDPTTAAAFDRILEAERPDLVHLHALTAAVSLRLARTVKRRGIRLIFTYHTPTISCQRGTLLRWGSEVCDGVLDLTRCTACTLQGLGVPRVLAELAGRTPVAVGAALEAAARSGGVWTALRLRELMRRRHAAVRAVLAEADRVVALCAWGRDLLLRNGVPPAKIVLARHGLPDTPLSEPAEVSDAPARSPIRLIVLGRLDPTKGVHVLLRAVRRIPAAALTLDIYGIVPGAREAAYLASLRALAAGDPRVVFHPALPPDEVAAVLRRADALVVPSQWLETGPLVVLEAFAVGRPVLGSNLGGIAELVMHEINGLLIEPRSVPAWAGALAQMAAHPEILTRLRTGIRPPRTMVTVADEMATLYRRLLSAGEWGR